ncbi:MAG: antitoxin family protein [Desulfurococcales archaeon]|nr:antitoxin family protein [Desulfurococcales archaeon]
MSKVIRVRYEKGVLKPLEPLELREGEEIRIQVLPEEFPELVDKVSVEASEDVDKTLREARERWKRWY